jgi:hypothetical protein
MKRLQAALEEARSWIAKRKTTWPDGTVQEDENLAWEDEPAKTDEGRVPGKRDGTGPWYLKGKGKAQGWRGKGDVRNCPIKKEGVARLKQALKEAEQKGSYKAGDAVWVDDKWKGTIQPDAKGEVSKFDSVWMWRVVLRGTSGIAKPEVMWTGQHRLRKR